MSTPRLKLPTSNRIKIFRCLDVHFRADPKIRETFRVIRSWTGDSTDRIEHSSGQLPYASLSIRGGPQVQWASSTKMGDLTIDIVVATPGTCMDDLDNAWAAFERASYPRDATTRLALQDRLRTAGAHTGVIEFSSMAFDPRPESDYLVGSGSLSVAYRFDEHPTTPGI